MPKVQDFYQAVGEIAPYRLAEKWDNVGLLVGDMDAEVTSVLVAMDATESVIAEAEKKGANLLVTHHPVIFQPLKSVQAESTVYRLIRKGIHVISAHTNLDIAQGGVNDQLAHALGLSGIRGLEKAGGSPYCKITVMAPSAAADKVYRAMAEAGAGTLGGYSHCAFLVEGQGRFKPMEGANPHIGQVDKLERVAEIRLEMLAAPDKLGAVVAAMKQAHPYEEPAYDIVHNYALEQIHSLGRLGELAQPLTADRLAELVKEKLGVGGVKYIPGCDEIRTVAVCGGSGADLLYTAKAMGAQALVTGESKHHLWLDAEKYGVTLIDAEHFATEAVVLRPLCDRLKELVKGAAVQVAEDARSNIKYR